MLCVARNEDVLVDINACSGALLYGDDGQTIEEFIQYLLALLRGLRGDAIADLRAAVEHAAAVANLGKSTDAAHCCCGDEGTQIVVVYVGRKARRAEWVKTGVLVQFERKSIRAHGAIEDNKASRSWGR